MNVVRCGAAARAAAGRNNLATATGAVLGSTNPLATAGRSCYSALAESNQRPLTDCLGSNIRLEGRCVGIDLDSAGQPAEIWWFSGSVRFEIPNFSLGPHMGQTAGAAEDHGRKSSALSVRVLPFERVALDNRVTEVRG